jgi:hypothetical protein
VQPPKGTPIRNFGILGVSRHFLEVIMKVHKIFGPYIEPVHKSDIPAALDVFSRLSGLDQSRLTFVGSTGKTDQSGDIDLCCVMDRAEFEVVHHRLTEALGEYAVDQRGVHLGSYAVPHPSYHERRVQIDLIYTLHPEWTAFSYFSAGAKSAYKGAVRTALLSAVTSITQCEVSVKDETDQSVIARVGLTFVNHEGLVRTFKLRHRRIRGEGYVKAMERVSPDTLADRFPGLVFDPSEYCIDDPRRGTEILFGQATTPADVETAEQVVDLVSRRFPADADQIFRLARERLGSKPFAVPEEMRR